MTTRRSLSPEPAWSPPPQPRSAPLFYSISTGILLAAAAVQAQEVPYGFGQWNSDTLGNHRAVVHVASRSDAVWVHLPWRRRDEAPELKRIIVVDAATGDRVTNLARIDVNREFGDLVFQPRTVPGDYFVYYLPYVTSGRSNYPTVVYPPPEATATGEWLSRHELHPRQLAAGDWRALPQAEVLEFQAIDELNSFWPMEVIASAAEIEALRAAYPADSYLLFPEDRTYPIRMVRDLPLRWIDSGPKAQFRGEAARGEFYVFQVGIYAMRGAIEDVKAEFEPLISVSERATLSASGFRCFNLGGIDSSGSEFTLTLPVEAGTVQPLWCGVQVSEDAAPGTYVGAITIMPSGLKSTTLRFELEVAPEVVADHGDDEPWRHSRLRWLDSRIALDDEIVEPYTPVTLHHDTIGVLGRQVTLTAAGFPERIHSFFAPEMTHLVGTARQVLASPVQLAVEGREGEVWPWQGDGPRIVKRAAGVVIWSTKSSAGTLTLDVDAEMDFDGNVEFTTVVSASESTTVNDIRLVIPIARDVAKYMMGLGYKGGYRPSEFSWKWDVRKNQDGAWIGDVNAGLQFSLRDENYSRPLNTNFYHSKPLVLPSSWSNGGQGGCQMNEEEASFVVTCFSGRRTIAAGERLYFNFRLLLTPFRPIVTAAHWRNRYFHRFEPIDSIRARGATVINVHHATEINPYINYPFLRPEAMKAYVDEAHAKDMKVKIYYTVRELTNRAPEIFALRSLGHEIFSPGPGGGFSWLQEHLVDDYIAAWFVPRLKDAAIINSGVSRWHNYYLEGLNWLVGNVGIDGLYIDDVAFDRVTMKRVRKILDRGGPGKLIDLHSANQFNERDGYANSANLYLEHFPYIDRLWFGEYFDYDSPPDFWLTEVSGIPFGLMGEMLQDGGNPWRGMLFGMTNRMPWSGDPSPIWELWDEFGIQESRMIGYWVPNAPVRTHNDHVLATTYVRHDRALVSLATWATDTVGVRLDVDWDALDIDPARARLSAPDIPGFQTAREFGPADEIPLVPGRGWLIVIDER